MSRTAAGAALTLQHRARQVALRALTLRQVLTLWPLFDGDRATFDRFVTAAVPLVQARHRDSSGLAVNYYQAFRTAEAVKGAPEPRLAPFEPEKVVTSLYVTGPVSYTRALRSGQSATQARQTAFVTLTGSVTRHVLDGGRGTLMASVAADRQALGWARVTSGRACAFCAMLAGRGAVYRESTANFRSHDHCSCTAEPVYEGADLPETSQHYADLYRTSIARARADGTLASGTKNDLLNTFRRAYEGR